MLKYVIGRKAGLAERFVTIIEDKAIKKGPNKALLGKEK